MPDPLRERSQSALGAVNYQQEWRYHGDLG